MPAVVKGRDKKEIKEHSENILEGPVPEPLVRHSWRKMWPWQVTKQLMPCFLPLQSQLTVPTYTLLKGTNEESLGKKKVIFKLESLTPVSLNF